MSIAPEKYGATLSYKMSNQFTFQKHCVEYLVFCWIFVLNVSHVLLLASDEENDEFAAETVFLESGLI